MIGRRELPIDFRQWNARWGAPYGRRLSLVKRGLRKLRTTLRLPCSRRLRVRQDRVDRFAGNRTTPFEYLNTPWAYHAVRRRGSRLRVLEIGGGLSGLQFVLAAEGDHVVNVDPGQGARGWEYDADVHRRLCWALGAPVELFPQKIDSLEASPHSFDVILSVSALEHFSDADLAMVAGAMKRLLKPDGIVVMTIDLFLDLKPFSDREANVWGRNLDISRFLNMAGLRLEEGDPAELLGFPEFKPSKIMGNLASYLVGEGYPALSQCVIARLDHHD